MPATGSAQSPRLISTVNASTNPHIHNAERALGNTERGTQAISHRDKGSGLTGIINMCTHSSLSLQGTNHKDIYFVFFPASVG